MFQTLFALAALSGTATPAYSGYGFLTGEFRDLRSTTTPISARSGARAQAQFVQTPKVLYALDFHPESPGGSNPSFDVYYPENIVPGPPDASQASSDSLVAAPERHSRFPMKTDTG